MAQAEQLEQVSSNLNELLEDALEELLLDDESETEVKGRPNIDESLKKITEVENKLGNRSGSPRKSEDTETRVPSTHSKDKQQCEQQPGTSSGEQSSSTKVIDEEEMNRFFASMTEKLKDMPKIDPEEARTRITESVPQIFDLMQNLLSKELLYPALKDLAPKFEDWLQKNLAHLSKEDRKRYKKQIRKIHEIIEVFDDETLDNQERFEKNLDLMEQMQALGAPPEELTVPEGMNRCSIM